jgi:tetratricopeptide (TPR) repeat protein
MMTILKYLLAMTVAAVPVQDKATLEIKEAFQLEARGNPTEAISRFARIYKSYPGTSQSEESLYEIFRIQNEKTRDYRAALDTADKFMEEFTRSRYIPAMRSRQDFLKKLSVSDSEPLGIFEEGVSNYFRNPDIYLKNIGDIPVKYPGFSIMDRIYLWLGDEYASRNNMEKAFEYYMGLVEKFPASESVADAKRAIANYYARKGEYAKAREAFIELSGSSKDHIRYEAVGKAERMARHLNRRTIFMVFCLILAVYLLYLALRIEWRKLTARVAWKSAFEILLLVPVLAFLCYLSRDSNPLVTDTLFKMCLGIPALIYVNNLYLSTARMSRMMRVLSPFLAGMACLMLTYMIMEGNDLVFILENSLRMR